MTPRITSIYSAANLLGNAVDEIVAVEDSPAGVLITVRPNTRFIDVPADSPDADGKTGLMLLVAPTDPYHGTYPVYAQPQADDADVVELEPTPDPGAPLAEADEAEIQAAPAKRARKPRKATKKVAGDA